MKTGWIRFAAALLPDAKDLLRDLWKWHKGDIPAARAALLKIRDHGMRLDEAEEQIDARMQAMAVEDAEVLDPKTKA